MPVFTFQALVDILRDAVTSVPDIRILTGADEMADLGIDSLTTLNVIMAAAETFSLDLDGLEDYPTPPTTLAELHSMLLGLPEVRSVA